MSSTRAGRDIPKDCGFSLWGPQVELESRESGAIAILGGMGHKSSGHRILMNIISMVRKVVRIANSMIGESALPYLGTSPANSAERMGVSALDQLDGALDGYVLSGSQQEMDMI